MPRAVQTQLVAIRDTFAVARLMAYLRPREPDNHIGYLILIYELTDEAVEEAIHGPPVDMGNG